MDGYVRARMLPGLVQHPLAVDGPAERGVGACQQQPGRQLPRQWPIGPLRGKRLLECLDRLTEKPALGGHHSGHDAGDRPGEIVRQKNLVYSATRSSARSSCPVYVRANTSQ